jgi:fructose-specific phosphotransferase system IIC component
MLLVIPYFILSVFVDVDFSGNIDHAAHGGGALMGILIAMFLCEMPEFIIKRVPNGERRIQLIALIAIIGYFSISLLVFYIFTRVSLT